MARLLVASILFVAGLQLASGQQSDEETKITRTWFDENWRDHQPHPFDPQLQAHGPALTSGPDSLEVIKWQEAVKRMSTINELICGQAPAFDSLIPVENAFQCSKPGGGAKKTRHMQGARNTTLDWSKQSGRTLAASGSFPSFVRVEVSGPRAEIGSCGGVLVSPSVVLTERKCVELQGSENSNINVRFGLTSSEMHQFESRALGYCVGSGSEAVQNLAIVVLSAAVKYGRYVQPACLPFRFGPDSDRVCFSVQNDLSVVLVRKMDDSSDSAADKPTCWTTGDRQLCPGDHGGIIYCLDNCDGHHPRQFAVGLNSVEPNTECNSSRPQQCVLDTFKLSKELASSIGGCRKTLMNKNKPGNK